MTTEPANTRLRQVTDFDDRRPPAGPAFALVAGALALVASVALWFVGPWGSEPLPKEVAFLELMPIVMAATLLLDGRDWFTSRIQLRWPKTRPDELLSHAPVALRDLRVTAAFTLLPIALWLVAGVVLLSQGSLWFGVPMTILGVLSLLTGVERLVRPRVLVVRREGFGPPDRLIAWSEVGAFRVDKYLWGTVDFDYVELPARRFWRFGGKRRTGSLRADGPMPADKLAELLNAARARWT